jgi:hypothetical protein
MKSLIKIVAIGLLALLFLAGISSLFDDSKVANKENMERADRTNSPVKKEPKALDEEKFKLENAKSLARLLLNVDSCLAIALSLADLEGTVLEVAMQRGEMMYNYAYKDFQELQEEANSNLPNGKSQVIKEALRTCSEVFSNRFSPSITIEDEIKFVRTSLEGFPSRISQIERDYDDGIFRIIAGPSSKKEVNLTGNQTWCLTEIVGGDGVILEGTFPANGYGKFELKKDQLPVLIGAYKVYSR